MRHANICNNDGSFIALFIDSGESGYDVLKVHRNEFCYIVAKKYGNTSYLFTLYSSSIYIRLRMFSLRT